MDSLRSKLRQETAQDVGGPGAWDTHHIAAAAEKKNEKFRQAFGISKDYVGGSAFDAGHKAMKAAQREEELVCPCVTLSSVAYFNRGVALPYVIAMMVSLLLLNGPNK